MDRIHGAAAVALLATLAAAEASPAAHPSTAPAVLAYPAAARINDGRLDGLDWAKAIALGPFTGPLNPDGPDVSLLPAYRTEARILWRPDALCVAFICHGPPPWATFKNHDDDLYKQDSVELFLDVAGDMREYAELQASPLGVTADYYHTWDEQPSFPREHLDFNPAHHHSDKAWDLPGLNATGSTLRENGKATGWTVQMVVPVGSLLEKRGLPPLLRPGQTIYVNLLRYAWVADDQGKRQHRQLNWGPTLKGRPHVTPMAMQPIECSE